MNFKKLLKVINACVYISVWSSFLLNPLHAHHLGAVVATMTGPPLVTGFMNEHNTLTIVITMNNADYNGGEAQAFVAYAEKGDTPNIVASTTVLGNDVNIQSQTATLTIYNSNIENANSETYDHEQSFDIKIRVDASGEVDEWFHIDNWVNVGNTDFLTYDADDPRVHAIGSAAGVPSGGFLSYEYFNSLALTFTMSQAWLNPSVYTDYRSKITFTGISGTDNGGVHQYYLPAKSLNATDIISSIKDNSAYPGSASP
ncbi:uncharacterized protein METZ01_LOCUS389829, partial [marine metagenome]